ncbi:sensor histidine kinase [Micromonospora sp. NPDC047620]|uniref:sensor histidine kinase n=1 Tax=Micromonospora sp. NPDC047620 TaxID=3364251 RepID=UPI003720F5C3
MTSPATTQHNGGVVLRVLGVTGRALLSRRSWAALAYLLITAPLDVAGAILLLAGGLVGTVLLVTPLGPWLLASVLSAAAGLGAARRATAGWLLDEHVPTPPRPDQGRGLFARRRAVLTDPANWRALGYLLIKLPLGLLSLAVGGGAYVYAVVFLTYPLQRHGFAPWRLTVAGWALGVVLLLAAPWLVRSVLLVDRALIRGLLGPSRTAQRMRHLRETRDRAVSDADATLRRIERDLHDGTQARLVGVGMQLTLVRELLGVGASVEQIRAAVDTAQGNLTTALAELRDLVRGIRPPVLDNGLAVALATVASGSTVSVSVEVDLPSRPSPAVEHIAYFCACELLTNVNRHSAARHAVVEITDSGGVLRLRVRDDGRGGAYRRPGGGLAGLAERIQVVDGTLSVDSPPGGPTVATVDIPVAASERSTR